MVDIEVVIDKLASLDMLKPIRKTGDWMTCRCPFHSDGNEKKPSFGILLKDQYRSGTLYKAGFGHCFACQYKNSLEAMVQDILKLHAISGTAADWFKDNIPGFNPSDMNLSEDSLLVPSSIMASAMKKYAVEYVPNMFGASDVKYVSEEELAKYRYVVPYMYERKLTDAIIAEYDIGFDANWIPPGRSTPVPCITIPVRDAQGRTLFLCRRSIKGKLYNYPEGTSKPVFGVDRLSKGCKTVVVCESAINALTAKVYGYDAVALLGTGNSYQKDQLRRLGLREFVLCFDGDEAGRRANSKWRKALSDIAIVWSINMPDGKDLNDLSKPEFDMLYSERE